MGRYILRRVFISIPVLFGITLVTYLIVSLAPGDPVSAMVDPEQAAALGPGWMEQQRAELGLDKPLPVRYGLWLKEVVTGNLGYSFSDRQPVSDKIAERIWPTLKLMLTVQLLALAIGVPIGVLSAIRQYSLLDYAATVFGFATISIPAFFLALAGIYVLPYNCAGCPRLVWQPSANHRRSSTRSSISSCRLRCWAWVRPPP
jgi:peptide/nickel transport system permease protein